MALLRLTSQNIRFVARRFAGTVVPVSREGDPNYIYADRLDFPAPKVKFVRDENLTPEMKSLKDKEAGDWKNLTADEKIQLYRLSFNKTYAEMRAPTGEMRYIIGGICIGLAVSALVFGFQKKFISPELPHSLNEEWQEEQLKYNISIRNNPVTGVASQWDYEKNEWKK
ncbi:cytochrome c oxidase subunit 4 isoform 1, mitochondrial-like [Anneissia japonica]|uniref:cytochrome c oxidase subunit 4 isoform 1, mitochondrial-like n=1 Tax=Anneissia japonica TaxID=1529436 RepID=UPI0014259A27|nr:cytochrome c oxidase subunit 4 isoform 1, mitochondrial-like [Anneissia japonica]